MGEIADLMREGGLCETCGVYLDGEAPGHPRRCDDCPPMKPPPPRIAELLDQLKAASRPTTEPTEP